MELIDKNKLLGELKKLKRNLSASPIVVIEDVESLVESLEVKNTDLDKFKSLQHMSGDLKSTLQDWGYAPNLYHFDGNWHVDWISCEEGDSIKGFTGDTAEEAINKAYDWFHSTFCNS